MKTLTEFFGPALKTALKAKEDLVAAGKTAEELPAAIGEALKVEGDKLKHLLSALEAVGSKWGDLKRVVVLGLNEGEKAPGQAQLIGEAYFVTEYYAPVGKPVAARGGRDDSRGGRGDKKRGGGKREGRGGRDGGGRGGDSRREGGDRPARAPRSEAPMAAGAKPVIGPRPTPKAATEQPKSES